MRVFETKLHQFKISGITRNAKEKVGNDKPTPKLISAIYKKSAKTLELLFEVQSFSGKNKHSTMTGQMRELPSGYAVVLRFENLENPDLNSVDGVTDIFATKDVKVHCDCPAFYWQGMYESDDLENNTKYKFASTRGHGEWDLRHAEAGGTPGEAFCKHLSVVQDWILDDWNEFWTQFQQKRRIEERFVSPYE